MVTKTGIPKSLDRPDSVKIGPFVWTITYDLHELHRMRRDGGDEVYGITLCGDLRIIIDDQGPEQFIKNIVLHEFWHAFLYTFSIQVSMTKKMDEYDREEQFVASTAAPLLDCIQSNPDFFYWLAENDI